MANVKSVQVQMIDKTLEKLDSMKNSLHNENRSAVVKTAIDIADVIVTEVTSGSSIILERSDGSRKQIIIPGLD